LASRVDGERAFEDTGCGGVVAGHAARTRELAEERAAIQAEGEAQAPPSNGGSGASQLLLKRSVSPDGRIDSLSVELSTPIDGQSATAIRTMALNAMRLQADIVKDFLKKNGKPNSNRTASQTQTPRGNGAAFARLLDVGVTNGQYGERFYLNVEVNGRRARFFGTAGQVAKAISVAGERLYARDIEPGIRLDLPCRVLTETSRDGRYLNVTKVLPLQGRTNGGTS